MFSALLTAKMRFKPTHFNQVLQTRNLLHKNSSPSFQFKKNSSSFQVSIEEFKKLRCIQCCSPWAPISKIRLHKTFVVKSIAILIGYNYIL